jgi:hypothetical protein
MYLLCFNLNMAQLSSVIQSLKLGPDTVFSYSDELQSLQGDVDYQFLGANQSQAYCQSVKVVDPEF